LRYFYRKAENNISTIKLIVADDHIMRREGLVCLLRTHPEFVVVEEVTGGNELLDLPLNPAIDIILADANLPTPNNVDPTLFIQQWNPSVHTLILADHATPLPAIRAFRNGAHGYITRMEDFSLLTKAIQSISQGRRYLSQALTDQVLNAVIEGRNFEESMESSISPREREILQMVAEGRTNAEIGKILVISTRTVETHRKNLMRKLGLTSQFDILRYAVKQGLITFDL
jgi:DNA-binding NarL/FixJ family response regulator